MFIATFFLYMIYKCVHKYVCDIAIYIKCPPMFVYHWIALMTLWSLGAGIGIRIVCSNPLYIHSL